MVQLDTKSILGFNLVELIVSLTVVPILLLITLSSGVAHKWQETEANIHSDFLIKEAQDSRLQFGHYPNMTKTSHNWEFELWPITNDKAILTASPLKKKGRTLTIVITPKHTEGCWAKNIDTTVSTCQALLDH